MKYIYKNKKLAKIIYNIIFRFFKPHFLLDINIEIKYYNFTYINK